MIHPGNAVIKDAEITDAKELTKIAFAAKKHWDYPEEYFEKWRDELTITDKYIRENIVRLVKIDNKIAGFYSIVNLRNPITFSCGYMENGFWLDHMFIDPNFHNQGIGTRFFEDINGLVTKGKIIFPLRIFVDPNAAGFYKKMGAKEFRISGSSIPGRNIPVFMYQ